MKIPHNEKPRTLRPGVRLGPFGGGPRPTMPWLRRIVGRRCEGWNLNRGSLKRRDIPLSTGGKLLDIQCPLDRSPLGLDLLLEKIDSINQLLGPRWTAGNVDIDRDDLIDSLNQRVIIENAA